MDEERRASCQYGSLECTKWKTDVDQTGIPTPVCIKTCQSVLVKGIVDTITHLHSLLHWGLCRLNATGVTSAVVKNEFRLNRVMLRFESSLIISHNLAINNLNALHGDIFCVDCMLW